MPAIEPVGRLGDSAFYVPDGSEICVDAKGLAFVIAFATAGGQPKSQATALARLALSRM
jgi:hypothetical protein